METPSEDSVLLNICIIPEAAVGERCVVLSQSLPTESVQFKLDGKNKFPHMTVCMARFPAESIQKVAEVLQGVLEKSQSVLCAHTGYFITKGGYIEVSYKKTEQMLALQESISEAIKEFRENPGAPYEEKYFAPYIAEQQTNAKNTGYDLVGDLYRPHISLSRYKEGMRPDTLPEFPAEDLSFVAHTIALGKADENGAVYTVVNEFSIT